ncbi:TerB family tellurite resistance protein [Lutibacter sp.]|uniref:TerB family tellurite resistance protein n=1 Tax=Lutibacter sp. TaxID=1925666 RepID=UPI0027329343|nr:TerB family tellurite resistance protein [Lutibacter sp.]MDP3312844.1 TerB family tellurite resistance protein [Lutibacter sp.]
MANFVKWIGAGLGFTLGGPIGSVLGFVLGSVLSGFSKQDIEQVRQYRSASANAQSGDFEISLLLLSAVVIKADGKVNQTELNFVRQHFIVMYGEERANNAFKLFKGFTENNDFSTRQVCIQIRQNLSHAARLQLLHFLFGIAKADGIVSELEIGAIKTLAGYLNINHNDFESIKAMFYESVNNAYVILEIDKNVSNEEVKLAYRKMVKKHHPDKLQHLGDEHVKGAEDKFKEVQKAYEQIKSERNM